VAIPIAVGLYVWDRGREKRFGRLLTLVAFVWALTALAESGNDVAYSAGRLAGWVFEAGLVYLVLAFPTGRLSADLDRRLAGAAVALVALLFLPTTLLVESFPSPSAYGGCDADCPGNAFMLIGSEPAWVDSLLRPLRELLSALLFLAVTLRLTQRVRRATPAMRRTLSPVLAVAAARCAVYALAFPIRALAGPSSSLVDVVTWLLALALPSMAIAFLLGELRSRLFISSALERLGMKIGAAPSPWTLRTAVAETVGDPSLEVAYWAPDVGGWVDAGGSLVPVPDPGSERAFTEIRHNGHRVAGLTHDPALLDEDGFVEAVGVYALVALENQRLLARVEASTREVHESRSRIVASADRERRRIERDLHDGAQQQLVALRIHLELMGETLERDPTRARERLHALGDEVEQTLDSIRSLAHGVYPALLEDQGLVEALRSVANGMPIHASVNPDGSGRYTPEVESAVYFCCLEALQNAAKHAHGASAAVIELSDNGTLRAEVRDDGAGFDVATVDHGSGLVNMRDRLSAVGGELATESSPGRGARIVITIPLDG
jgi:signal transduction histidine kinase